jgi:TatD DNase family protein
MELVDIGVNLAHRRFAHDRAAVLARAAAAGVSRIVVTGTSVAASREAAALHVPGRIYSTAGVHPHDSRHLDEAGLAELERLAGTPGVVAIGECGLDFDRDFSPRPDQERAFVAQLELAARTGKPLFLHERAAHRRFVDLIAPLRSRLSAAVVHCFTGSAEELDAYLALDLHIGITGWICDERRGEHLLPLVARIPADRLMLETDAPFLTPRTARPRPAGGRNEPALLTWVLETVARAAGKPAAQVAAETTRTAEQFFALPPPTSR